MSEGGEWSIGRLEVMMCMIEGEGVQGSIYGRFDMDGVS